jgi:predicted  nucleic acid-binding Zn-ribbon protein
LSVEIDQISEAIGALRAGIKAIKDDTAVLRDKQTKIEDVLVAMRQSAKEHEAFWRGMDECKDDRKDLRVKIEHLENTRAWFIGLAGGVGGVVVIIFNLVRTFF